MDLTGSSPADNVKEDLNPLGFERVTKFTDPPIASPSMSGVIDLFTSIVWIIPEGIKSNCTFLLFPSADGILSPLSVTELRPAANPLITTFLASPISPCMDTPETLLRTSPTLLSGNLPTWSAEIILVTFRSAFCWFNPFTIPLEYPETTISANSVAEGASVKSWVVVVFSESTTEILVSSKPIYETLISVSPASTSINL